MLKRFGESFLYHYRLMSKDYPTPNRDYPKTIKGRCNFVETHTLTLILIIYLYYEYLLHNKKFRVRSYATVHFTLFYSKYMLVFSTIQ